MIGFRFVVATGRLAIPKRELYLLQEILTYMIKEFEESRHLRLAEYSVGFVGWIIIYIRT